MSPITATSVLSPKAILVLGLSLLSVAPSASAWELEFWADQADCNHRKGDSGREAAADTTRSGLDHMSNNCMSMSYDPTTLGMMAMRVTGWTDDCAIALWSDKAGSIPCQAEYPYGISSDSQPPDVVFTMKSPEAALGTDEDGNKFACISPLNGYVQSNSGFLGYVAYSCGGNGTLLVDEYEKNYDSGQMRSVIRSLTATSTSEADKTTTSTHKKNSATGTGSSGNKSDHKVDTATAANTSGVFTTARLRIGVPVRPTPRTVTF
ncbi:hypothetical protein F5Y04DRAFT_288915 [Hypomontagnella monticulosa]|nr:hypothetical protein F5Y04DRAFT_288915 [Hypomontagnella monticulosa]